MVLWSILSLRKVLFNNLNMAVAFSTIIQMLLISLLFTQIIKYLYELGIPKKVCYIIAIIYGFTPLFGLWLSIMAATPVFCELRYIYGLFTCIPLLIITPIILKSKKD